MYTKQRKVFDIASYQHSLIIHLILQINKRKCTHYWGFFGDLKVLGLDAFDACVGCFVIALPSCKMIFGIMFLAKYKKKVEHKETAYLCTPITFSLSTMIRVCSIMFDLSILP